MYASGNIVEISPPHIIIQPNTSLTDAERQEGSPEASLETADCAQERIQRSGRASRLPGGDTIGRQLDKCRQDTPTRR